ncbi:MAG: M56 family metallopeptidase [Pseudomonadota bacterium]
MLFDIALNTIVKGSVLLALVLLFVQRSTRNTAAVKHNKLAAALLVLLILPMLEMAPKLALQVLPTTSELVPDPAARWLPVTSNMALVIGSIYVVGVLVGLLRILLDYAALRRQLKYATEFNVAALPLAVQRQLSAGNQKISFWLLNDLRCPITIGALSAKVILPREFLTQSSDVINAALQHELAHIRRHDWVIQLITRLIVAFFWFNPLVHACARGLRNQAEIAADDEVVLAGTQAPSYAGVLLGYARQQGKIEHKTKMPLWAAMLGPGLADRVHALTQRTPRHYYDGFGLTESVVFFLLLLLPFTVLRAVPIVQPTELKGLPDNMGLSASPYMPVIYELPPMPAIGEPSRPFPHPPARSMQWLPEPAARPVAHRVVVQGPEPAILAGQLTAATTPTISRSGFMPTVTVMPIYPLRAISRNIEGFVDVLFDIQTDGTVANARVVHSKPGRIFDRAALNAIRKSRYAPHQVNGTAVKVQDVENRYVFRLTDTDQNATPEENPEHNSSEVLIAQGVRYDHL